MVHTQGYLVWLLAAVTSGATACISHSMVAQLQDAASVERASPKTQVEAARNHQPTRMQQHLCHSRASPIHLVRGPHKGTSTMVHEGLILETGYTTINNGPHITLIPALYFAL